MCDTPSQVVVYGKTMSNCSLSFCTGMSGAHLSITASLQLRQPVRAAGEGLSSCRDAVYPVQGSQDRHVVAQEGADEQPRSESFHCAGVCVRA